jgi:MscS family membrane protein
MAKRAEVPKTEAHWTDLLLESIIRPLSLFIRVYGVYWALSPIWSYFDTPGSSNLIHHMLSKAADLGGTVALFWFLYRFVHILDVHIRKRVISSSCNGINEMLVPLISKTVRIFVIFVGGMLVVQNMTGIEIGPLVASLGIGGLAFALAGKDSIANFLGSLTILLDKPFQAGERIVIEKHDGFVEGGRVPQHSHSHADRQPGFDPK